MEINLNMFGVKGNSGNRKRPTPSIPKPPPNKSWGKMLNEKIEEGVERPIFTSEIKGKHW